MSVLWGSGSESSTLQCNTIGNFVVASSVKTYMKVKTPAHRGEPGQEPGHTRNIKKRNRYFYVLMLFTQRADDVYI